MSYEYCNQTKAVTTKIMFSFHWTSLLDGWSGHTVEVLRLAKTMAASVVSGPM